MKDISYRRYTCYKDFVDLKKLDFIVQSMEEYLKNQKKSALRVLDIGCGNGGVSLPLASLGYNVWGIDLDKDVIYYLNDVNQFPNATFSVEDAERIDPNKRFDVIICSEVLEHMDCPQLLLGSIRRLMKENGIAIITIPNGYGPWELLFDLPLRFGLYISHRLAKKEPKRGMQHVQNFSMKRFRKLCETVGKLQVNQVGHSDFVSGFWMLRKSRISRYDAMLADRLPYFLVSGWYFILTLFDAA